MTSTMEIESKAVVGAQKQQSFSKVSVAIIVFLILAFVGVMAAFLAVAVMNPAPPKPTLKCPSSSLRHLNGVLMDDIAPVTAYVSNDNAVAPEIRATWAGYVDWYGTNKVSTYSGWREANTRMAIHMHEFGGQTCVLKGGAATVFVEGGPKEGTRYPAGTCYYMPPNTYMTSSNLDSEDSLTLDTLNSSPDGTIGATTVCEHGWSDVIECRNAQNRGCGSKWAGFVAAAVA